MDVAIKRTPAQMSESERKREWALSCCFLQALKKGTDALDFRPIGEAQFLALKAPGTADIVLYGLSGFYLFLCQFQSESPLRQLSASF